MRDTVAVVAGVILTVLVHALLTWFLAQRVEPRIGLHAAAAVSRSQLGTVRHGLCGKRRCTVPEQRKLRRDPEPDPLEAVEILEAALMPALGNVEPNPKKLPELQTYEQPEVVEDGVNLDKENPEPENPLNKKFDPREAKRDPKSPKDLDELLKNFEEDDPRKRATALDRIVGSKDGEVDGDAQVKKAGNRYAGKVARAIRKEFVVPPFLDETTLRKLYTKVKIERLDGDGRVLSYDVERKSGNRGFDDGAVAAIKAFVPLEGGTERLPRPAADLLRYINEHGLIITLRGKHLTP